MKSFNFNVKCGEHEEIFGLNFDNEPSYLRFGINDHEHSETAISLVSKENAQELIGHLQAWVDSLEGKEGNK